MLEIAGPLHTKLQTREGREFRILALAGKEKSDHLVRKMAIRCPNGGRQIGVAADDHHHVSGVSLSDLHQLDRNCDVCLFSSFLTNPCLHCGQVIGFPLNFPI